MLTENVIYEIKPLVRIEEPSEKSRGQYVMQGSPVTKSLDIYHLIFAPTHACNLRCKHCYLPDHATELIPKNIALRLVDEWSEIVMEERGAFGGIFHIKGGEPFVVPYFWNLIDRLAELQSLQLMITTNGTFVDEEIFERLARCNEALDGHATIVVSLDGATEDTHSILRGPGQFARTLPFLEGIKSRGLTLHLNCVLHKGNVHELSAYIGLAKTYRASQVNFLSFVPRGIGFGFREFQLPHIEVYHEIDRLYSSGDKDTKALLAGSLSHIKQRESTGQYRTSQECVAAYRGMYYVTPDGNVNTCPNIVYADFAVGNVHKSTLKEIAANLPSLYNRLTRFSGPYLCSGERILAEKNIDELNQVSLGILSNELTVQTDEQNPSDCQLSELSYCYSRNY